MEKITAMVKVNKIHSYEAPGYGYNSGIETHYIYNMEGEDGRNYVWKTSKVMRVKNRTYDCSERVDNVVFEGDVLEIMGNFKANTEYKGTPQIQINRVEVLKRFFAGKSPEELIDEQIRSVDDVCDKLIEMPYWEYKNKFADCETIRDSYNQVTKTIKVIVRNYVRRMA